MKATSQLVAALGLIVSTLMAVGEEPTRDRADAMIESYLKRETAKLSRRFLGGAQSLREWKRIRPRLHREYLDMLGLWPLPKRTPLKAQVTGTLERDSFRVEKVHFQSRPGLYVTGNLYLPKKVTGRLPAVLYVCGHSGRGRDGNKTAFQHHGMWFATHGYVCLIIDTLQLGEIPGIHHGTYREERWWWQARGYTPAGVECWNGMRAIDYLQSRPEVDPNRIAVTGISGGGASTVWITAADDRVKVAVPVSGISDLESYVSDKVINGHCDCMFLVNTYRWEWTTILALIAPRPMLFLNSGHDRIFPMPGNERIRRRLERLYLWYDNRPGRLFDIGVTPGGHRDNLELRLMAYRWINRHLKKDNAEVHEPPQEPFPGAALRVFPTDDDLPRDSINHRIDESFVPKAEQTVPKDKSEFASWSRGLVARLRELCFREWPEQVPAATVVRRPASGLLELETEQGIRVTVHSGPATDRSGPPWLIVLNKNDPPDRVPAWAKGVIPDDAQVMLLSPRGCGLFQWSQRSPPNYVARAHALIGRTIDTGRVWDIQAVARWLHERDASGRTVAVAGQGRAGVLAAYAALFEGCIARVTAVSPPPSHRHGPIFLNVLRVLDTPEAFGLLAPMPLTLVDAHDAAWKRTEAIYRAVKAGDRIRRLTE